MAPDGAGHSRFLDALRRRWWLPVLCAALAGGGAFFFVATRPARYEATVLMRFTGRDINDQILGTFPSGTDIERTLAEAVPQIDQERTAVRALERLRFNPPLSPTEIQSATSVGLDTRQGMVAVRARQGNPVDAARVANAYARAYVDLSQRSDRLRIRRALDTVRGQLARTQASTRAAARRAGLSRQAIETAVAGGSSEVAALQQRLQQLTLLERLPPSEVSIARAATPPTGTSGFPPVIAGIAGAILGALLGVGLIALREGSDRRLRRPGDFEQALGAPVLARVPLGRALRRGRRSLGDLRDDEARAFRLLAAQLRYGRGARERHMLVVSPLGTDPAEDRPAWYVACAMAETGARTLFVDTTVVPRRGRSHDDAGALEEVLAGSIQAADAVRHAHDGLDVLACASPNGAAPVSRAAEIRQLLWWAEQCYDVVVVRTPPLATEADAVPFVQPADGVLVSCRRDASPGQARSFRDAVAALDTPVVGVIVMGARTNSDE